MHQVTGQNMKLLESTILSPTIARMSFANRLRPYNQQSPTHKAIAKISLWKLAAYWSISAIQYPPACVR